MVFLLFTTSVAAFSHIAHPSWHWKLRYLLHCTRCGGGQRIHFYVQLLLRSVLFVEHGYCSFLWQTWSIHARNVPVVGIIMPFDWMGNNSTEDDDDDVCMEANRAWRDIWMYTAQQWKDEEDLPIPIAHSICLLFVPNEPFPIPFHNCIFSARDCIDTGHGQEDIIAHPRLSLLSCTISERRWQCRRTFAPRKSKQAERELRLPIDPLCGVLQLISQNRFIWTMMIWYGGICCGWIHFDWEGTCTLKGFYMLWELWKLSIQCSRRRLFVN